MHTTYSITSCMLKTKKQKHKPICLCGFITTWKPPGAVSEEGVTGGLKKIFLQGKYTHQRLAKLKITLIKLNKM